VIRSSPDLECEILVIGAGPSGSALAGLLGRRGRDVLVVDRASFPRPKACGECLNPGGVAALDRLDLHDVVMETEPVSLGGWLLHTPAGTRARADFPGGRFGLGVERLSFDRVLLDAARAQGARVIESLRITEVDPGTRALPARAVGVTRDGEQVRIAARILVGADGLRSVVARGIGAVRRKPRLRKASLSWRIRGEGPSRTRGRLLLGGDLTVGLAPVPEGPDGDGVPRWNASLVVDSAAHGAEISQDPWSLLLEGIGLMDLSWGSGPEVVEGPWASGPFDWPSRMAVVGRTLLVGDAAGYYDPLTGQGLYRALRSAELASHSILRALTSGPGELRAYDRSLRRSLGPGRRLQRAIEATLARSGLREIGIGALALSPRIASLVVSATGDLWSRGERRTAGSGNRHRVAGSRMPDKPSLGGS